MTEKKYEEKLITADGTVLPDPYTLVEIWKDNVRLLCDITWADIYNYLINMPSLNTNENLKAYKSLEAYNFMVSGHVDDVAYHGNSNLPEFCFIKTKVIIKVFSFFASENIFSFFEIFLSVQVKTFSDFLRCFASMLQSYAITTLVVTYFVFILTYSYTVLDQYARVNSCIF